MVVDETPNRGSMPKFCLTRLPLLLFSVLLCVHSAGAHDDPSVTTPVQAPPQVSSTGAVILDVRRITPRHVGDGGVVLWDVHFNRPVTVSRHSNKTDPCHPKCRVVLDPLSQNTPDAPHLQVLLGEVLQIARYEEGSGTHALRFSYRVQSEDPEAFIRIKPGKLRFGDSWFLHDDLGEVAKRSLPTHALKSDRSQVQIDLRAPGKDPYKRRPFALRLRPSVPRDNRAWRVRLSGWDAHGVTAYAVSAHPEPPPMESAEWIPVEPRSRFEIRTVFQLPRLQPIPNMLTLHGWLRDEAGNISERVSERVRLDFRKAAPQDMNGPRGFVRLASGREQVHEDKVLLILNAEDPQGVSGYFVSESRMRPDPYEFQLIEPPEPIFRQMIAVNLSNAEGLRTLHVWFKDTVGNLSTAPVVQIIVDRRPPIGGAEGLVNGQKRFLEKGVAVLVAFDENGVNGYHLGWSQDIPPLAQFTLTAPAQRFRTAAAVSLADRAPGDRLFAHFRDVFGNISRPVVVGVVPSPQRPLPKSSDPNPTEIRTLSKR